MFVLFMGYSMINSMIVFPVDELVAHSCAESLNLLKSDFCSKKRLLVNFSFGCITILYHAFSKSETICHLHV